MEMNLNITGKASIESDQLVQHIKDQVNEMVKYTLDDLTDQVTERITADDLINVDEIIDKVVENIDYDDLARMVKHYVDFDDAIETEIGNQIDTIADRAAGMVDVEAEIQSLLDSFVVDSPCTTGRIAIDVVVSIVEEVCLENDEFLDKLQEKLNDRADRKRLEKEKERLVQDLRVEITREINENLRKLQEAQTVTTVQNSYL